MAKSKLTPTVKAETVAEVKHEPVVEPVTKVEESAVVAPSAPVQPVTVVVEKKSGGGWIKWCACCLVVLLLCCVCTVGGSYLLITRTGDIIKALTTSTRNEQMTRLDPATVGTFDFEQYFVQNPPRSLGNNKYEVIISEELLLKMMFANPENTFMLNYAAIDMKPGMLSFQLDMGGLLNEQTSRGGEADINGIPINVESLRGVFVNLDISVTPPKTISIKSIRIGESAIDFAAFAGSYTESFMDDFENSEFFQSIDTLEFNDGYLRAVMIGEPDFEEINPPSGF